MTEFNGLYRECKVLDELFDKRYNNYSKQTREKNILELLVELGELANETRCFKYWSVKGPSEKSIIIDEYADCFLMVLHFCNVLDIKLDEMFPEIKITDPIIQFKKLYFMVSSLEYELDKSLIVEIFSSLINLAKIFDFTSQDIINGCLIKIEKNKERLRTNY